MKKITLIALFLPACIFAGGQQLLVPSEYSSIQAAIEAADTGDTVLVDEGTYYENINFLGKAITVASHFIDDGDTSFISKTIIDGSQYTDIARAAVVTMMSGEDTTSILCGFTLTGGKGNRYNFDGFNYNVGGGVSLFKSGGLIEHNIMKDMEFDDSWGMAAGAGISAMVYENHWAVIRNNLITGNKLTGWAGGTGIHLEGGGIIVEGNTITDNEVRSDNNYSDGGGIWFNPYPPYNSIQEVIIRGNYISGNRAIVDNSPDRAWGGGIGIAFDYPDGSVSLVNNIICNNYSSGRGGGILIAGLTCISLINNTVVDNEAGVGGNNLLLQGGSDAVIMNNIFRSVIDNGRADVQLYDANSQLKAFYNVFTELLPASNRIIASGNKVGDPEFDEPSFGLKESSLAIGRACCELYFGGILYKAPTCDFRDSVRLDGIHQYIDIGAIESAYEPFELSDDASLGYIYLEDDKVELSLEPAFDAEQEDYVVRAPKDFQFSNLYAYPNDILSDITIQEPVNFPDGTSNERAYLITVNSPDGNSEKTYSVQLDSMSSSCKLLSLSVENGLLIPEFNPSTYEYAVKLDTAIEDKPEIFLEAVAGAFVDQSNFPNWRGKSDFARTAEISVTSEDGDYQSIYHVLLWPVGIENSTADNDFIVYPNPVSGLMQVRCNPVQATQVRMCLLNILGQEEKVLLNEMLQPGVQEFRFDVSGMKSGVYFLRLESDRMEVRKVVLR